MDPQSFIARAEAQRWLGIAEKLLIGHDLVGSKTFAIRARESDPRLEAAEQILAIADTLLAAEKRVVGTNGAHQPDYYAILQLVRFVQDTDHIASQYRRLAVTLNPHQNRFPFADQAFQLVNDAWAVLSNPMRKSMYDSDLDYPQQQMNNLGFNLEQQHHQQQQHQQQPHNFFSINQELPEQQQQQQQQTFQSRLHQSQQHQQLQQHNFLSQPNPVRPLPVREQEHVFQHREQEQLFQQQVQPFQVTSPPHQQARMSPQPQQHIQSPPATPQSPFSWPQSSQMSQPHQQIQHQHQHQVKQEQQHLQQVKQEHHMKHEQQLQQQMKQEQQKQQQLQQEQLKQQQLKKQQLQQEQLKQHQLKQQQLQEEQRKQQQLQQEQLKQQQLMEEQRKQQQLQEEQRKQQQLLEEQRQQQQLLEEQRKQQQLLEEQRKQQQLLEEQRKQQQLLEEQRKQQQLLEEQRKQQQLQEEQRKQQLLEEQQKQQLQEEQRKQEQLLEEQRKQEQLLEEQRKQQQLQEEQRKQQQLQEEQRKQQQLQVEQRKQELLQQEQQQDSARQSAAPVQHPYRVNSNNGVREEGTEPDAETEVVDDSPTFWTACPYCFYMYEYPKVYVECTLRCDNCKRAFQAVRISSPPPIIEGQDAYFYCWGFIPVGLSMSPLQKSNNRGRNSNWTPFSSLHNTSNNIQNHLNEQAAPKENLFVNKSSGPRIYIDDITDDMFIGISDPSSDSDTDWDGTKKQKSKRMDKCFKERIQVLALRAVYAKNSSVKNLKHGIPVQKGVEVPTVLVVETSKINVGSNPRKKPGQVAQERGKLDLNVEFNNNDGEETAPRMTAVTHVHEQGDEDNIEEGIEFFEGLDEYLSSLPILSVVNEEKVKAA